MPHPTSKIKNQKSSFDIPQPEVTTLPFQLPTPLPPPNQDYIPDRPIDTSHIFPEGPLRKTYQLLQPHLESLLGFPKLWRAYDIAQRRGPTPQAFANLLLHRLGYSPQAETQALEALQSQDGPIVVACNHPFGGPESLAMVSLLEAARPGSWKILSNQVLSNIPAFRDVFLFTDPLGTSPNSQKVNQTALTQSIRHLKAGGILALFPAARVSHRTPEGHITDRPWTDHAVRLAKAANAAITVLHVPGHNSHNFLKIPTTWILPRTLRLCKELTDPNVPNPTLQLAKHLTPTDAQKLAAQPNPGPKLQAWQQLRADKNLHPSTPPHFNDQQSKIPNRHSPSPTPPSSLPKPLLETDKFKLLFFQGDDCPGLLNELGRARETTFQTAGQGTGREIDLNPEDPYYHHLVLLDQATGTIAGAYRIGIVHKILHERGQPAVYLDHVFHIQEKFFQKLGPALELSRSFVTPAWQRDNQCLALLWKGLGKVANQEGAPTLFGSVTISNEHHPASRAILVEYLRNNHADTQEMCSLIQAKNPFQPTTHHHAQIAAAYQGENINTLAPLIHHLEQGHRGIPPLMRYYCSLGAKFLAYHVEPSFADALYNLLRVRLDQMPEAYKKRFLGE